MLAALRDHPFLSELPAASLRRLAAHAYRVDFAAGGTVFREGGVADRFFLIRRGSVRLAVEVPGRGVVDVETLGPDTALGWSWLVAPYQWHLSAVALERTTTVVIDAPVLRSLMAADAVVGYEIMRRFAAVMFDRLQADRARLTGGPGVVSLPEAAVAGPWAGLRAMVSAVSAVR
jgi:CRP/FNR family transcriptional regulator, cyclic AMP receptor protein